MTVVDPNPGAKALVVEAAYFALTSKKDPNVIFWNAADAHSGQNIPEGVAYLWLAPDVLSEHRTRILIEAGIRGITLWECTIDEMRRRLMPIWHHDYNRSNPIPVVLSDNEVYGGRKEADPAMAARLRLLKQIGREKQKEPVPLAPLPARKDAAESKSKKPGRPAKILTMPSAPAAVQFQAPKKLDPPVGVRVEKPAAKPAAQTATIDLRMKQRVDGLLAQATQIKHGVDSRTIWRHELATKEPETIAAEWDAVAGWAEKMADAFDLAEGLTQLPKRSSWDQHADILLADVGRILGEASNVVSNIILDLEELATGKRTPDRGELNMLSDWLRRIHQAIG